MGMRSVIEKIEVMQTEMRGETQRVRMGSDGEKYTGPQESWTLRMYSSMLLAEKEVNTLFFHFYPLIAFVNDLDTKDKPWNEKGRLKRSSALPQWVKYGPGCDFEVLTVFLFVKRKRFEFLLGAYHTFVIFYIFVRILVENHEADFFFFPTKSLVFCLGI